jgi:hypothetical protein
MRYVVRTVAWDKERQRNIDVLRLQIPSLEVVEDREGDSYKSFGRACALINDSGGVLLEDDIGLCSRFTERIEATIESKGFDKVYNFFEKPKCYFKTSYVGGSNFLWMQCIYLPPKLPLCIWGYYDEFRQARPEQYKGMATDCLIAYALTKERVKYWRIRPCLVQHLPFESVIGPRPKNRQTPYFIDDLEREGVDYDDLQPTKRIPSQGT